MEVYVMASLFAITDIEERLNCFGEFNRDDPICLKACAMNIRCAVSKKQFFEQEFDGEDIEFFDSVINE